MPLRLANLGYLGHMWELYAMWAWIVVFLHASFAVSLSADVAPIAAKLGAFATVGAGAIGCVAAGYLADRVGRTAITMRCDGRVRHLRRAGRPAVRRAPALLIAVCIVWGISIVADSAQFSASIAELADPTRVGTMLTVQTALGFTLTLTDDPPDARTGSRRSDGAMRSRRWRSGPRSACGRCYGCAGTRARWR